MSDGPDRSVDDEALLKFIRDPLRRRILFLLAGRTRGLSIRQIATLLKEPSRRVRHYIQALVDSGLVVVDEERPRRGTIERTYRAEHFPLFWLDDWPAGLSPTESKMILFDTMRLVFDTVTEAIAEGTFLDRPGWCQARTWREVDQQGWDELAEIHERALQEVIASVDRTAERLAKSDEKPIEMISALFLFEAIPVAD
jgi:DNA-binding transcriptional ArsR family regulator